MTTLSELQYKSFIKTIIFCPKCLSIPILSILPSNFLVKVICSCGTKIVDINTYLTEIENSNASIPSKSCSSDSQQPALSFCQTCQRHLCYKCLTVHDKQHIIPPIDIKCDIYKDSVIGHQKFLAFCFDCLKHFCKECNKGHEEHRIIYFTQIKKKCYYKRFEEYNKVVNGYKKVLKDTRNEMIKKLRNTMIKIEKNYGECIRKNDKILKLISFILKNYLLISTQGDHYQSIVNVITNTDFTIDDKTYRHLPKFKNNEERVTFFKSFSVIKENNLYEQKEKKYEKMISLNTFSRITTLNICNDKKHLILGKENGELGIYDMVNNTFSNEFLKAHDGLINRIIILSDNQFITSSSDLIKIWNLKKINGKLCYSFYKSYQGDNGTKIFVTLLPNNRFAFTTKNRFLYVYSLENESCLLKKYLYKKEEIDSCSLLIFVEKNNCIIINTSENDLLFYSVDKDSIKEEKQMKEINLFNIDSVRKDNMGRVIALGNFTKNKNIYLIVINTKTKCIDLVFDFYQKIPKNFFSMCLFLDLKNNTIITKLDNNCVFFLNLTSFDITNIVSFKPAIKIVHSTYQLNSNCFATLSRNNNICISILPD